MSNYPPPYPGPPTYPSPYAGPPAAYYPPPAAAGSPPARRAGLLMFVLGPVVLLMGACFVCAAAALPAMSRQPATALQVDDLRAKLPMPNGVSLEAVFAVAGVIVGLPGVAMLALAPFVRRGRTWATVTALVLAGLAELWLAFNVLAALLHAGSDANSLTGGCVGVVFAAAFGLLLAWLVAALRAGPSVDPYQQYLSQYYHHQQMAQAYGAQQPTPGYGLGGGYGYGAPPPPPPPATQPPPANP